MVILLVTELDLKHYRSIGANVSQLGDGAKFGTAYFPLKIDIIAKCERDFTTKFALLPNCCWRFGFIHRTIDKKTY